MFNCRINGILTTPLDDADIDQTLFQEYVCNMLIRLIKYNEESGKPFIIMSASGMMASVCIKVSILKKLSNKSVACNNLQ
jgi:hypothetical protein